MRLLFVLILGTLALAGCASDPAAPADAGPVPAVRVRLAKDVNTVTIGGGEMLAATGDVRRRLALDPPIAIRRTPSGWQIGTARLDGGPLTLRPAAGATLTIDRDAYRGGVELVPRGRGQFDVVNVVDVEGYLKGVVPREAGVLGEDEAYKAQAVAARTYALYIARTKGPARGHFDLAPDVGDQVYGGTSAETARTNDAVDATRGTVLAWGERPGEERIFKTYFSSSAGGATLSVADAFGEPEIPPLSAQDLGTYGSGADYWRWPDVVIPRGEITRRLRAWGATRGHALRNVGQIRNIEVVRRGPARRPAAFRVIDDRGRRFDLLTEEIRPALNRGTKPGDLTHLRSSWVEPVVRGDAIRFTDGHGWGHGVGMSQWAAQGMAAAGMDWREILLRSYPQAKLIRAY